MSAKWLLFDFDGTLLDSKECIFAVYRRLFDELNIKSPDDGVLETYIGPPIEQTIINYVDKKDVVKYCNRFREIYKTIDLQKYNRLYDGVPQMLSVLNENGKNLVLCTTKYISFAKEILRLKKIDQFFTFIAGSDPSNGIISKTDVINHTFSLGVDKNDCLLIGDTIYDAVGAEQTGIPIGIVTYGFGKKEDFIGREIAWYADSTEEIIKRLL